MSSDIEEDQVSGTVSIPEFMHEPSDIEDEADKPHYEEFYPEEFQKANLRKLSIRLPGEHSLWAHKLWNASKVTAKKIATNEIDVKGKTTLELGAGGSVPSITSVISGSAFSAVTDYPEKELIDNITINIEENIPENLRNNVIVRGYLWGKKEQMEPIIAAMKTKTGKTKFDIIYMADLIFNHNEHNVLADVICDYLADNGKCYVLYSHHLPPRRDRDLRFFPICARKGLIIEEKESVFTDRMFPEDDKQFTDYPLEWRQYVYYRVITKPKNKEETNEKIL